MAVANNKGFETPTTTYVTRVPINDSGTDSYVIVEPQDQDTLKPRGFDSTPGMEGGVEGAGQGGGDDWEQEDPDDEFDENSRKERRVLEINRTKLTEYVHDCSVLFPYMKEKKVFTVGDCQIIQHEVTSSNQMDRFVDIVLTKGPHAIGVMHEAMKRSCPFVFDVLTRLFSTAGVKLPESRKLHDDLDAALAQANSSQLGIGSNINTTSFKKRNTLRSTMRRHIDELTERCEVVKSQRDELQKALLQREKDINNLLNRRDQQIQRTYEDMLAMLATWRETMANQSDGSIQKMQELLSEHESIRREYENLEGEYFLLDSELGAARDRISKLLSHLQKKEQELSLVQEEKEALSDKLLEQQGVIQRYQRQLNRVGRDGGGVVAAGLDAQLDPPSIKPSKVKVEEMEEKMKVCQQERVQALDEMESLRMQFYEEKMRRKELEQKLRQSPTLNKSQSVPPDLASRYSEETLVPKKVQPLVEESIFMPGEDIGMEIGLAIVVRELSEAGNAFKHGVRLGDEIQQVNRLKIDIPPENQALEFTKTCLRSASQAVTLSIARQASPTATPSAPPPTTNLTSLSPASHRKLPLKSPSAFTPPPLNLEMESLVSFLKSPLSHPTSLRHLLSLQPSNSSSGRVSDEQSDDSDVNYVCSEPEYVTHKSRGQFYSQDSSEGIITSPKGSTCHSVLDFSLGSLSSKKNKGTLTGAILPERTILSPDGDPGRSKTFLQDEKEGYQSDSPEVAEHPINTSPRRHRNAIKKHRKKGGRSRRYRQSMEDVPRLWRSSDDIDRVWPRMDFLQDHEDSKDEDLRRVLLPSAQLGVGLSIIGGRGNGLFIRSERSTNRSLSTGDRIVKLCGRPTEQMMYAEAHELMEGFRKRDQQCILLVKHDERGYKNLGVFSRDNFYVISKISHKSRFKPELSFDIGDVFHVTDTKPIDLTNMWQVKQLNSRGQTIATGCIPITLEFNSFGNMGGSHSLPRLIHGKITPHKPENSMTLQQQPKTQKQVSAQSAFKLYRPVRKIAIKDPRPVVLVGVFESEFREHLVSSGGKDGLKFAYPNREPAEKIAAVLEDKIIESISIADGTIQSTVEDVLEVSRNGYHCLLSLTTTELAKPCVSSLRPIVIALSPHSRNIKVKMQGGRLPQGFNYESISRGTIFSIEEKIRQLPLSVSGVVEVHSAFNVEEVAFNIRKTVSEQQQTVFWEGDTAP